MEHNPTAALPRRITWATLILLICSISLVAQQPAARPDRGIMPAASYSVSDTENISLTNGNLNLSIPLASLPTMAGGKLKFSLNAVYNSKLWNVTRVEHQLAPYQGCANWIVNTPQKSDAGGWRITGAYAIEFRLANADFLYYKPQPPPPADPCQSETMDMQEQQRRQYDWYRAILIMPDGAEHELRPVDASQPYPGESSFLKNYYRDIPGTLQNSMRYYSIDGSYLWAVINADGTWTVYQNDGTRITQAIDGVQRIQDTNGNSIKIFSDTEGAHYQNEQTGREIKVTMDWNANGGYGRHSIQYQTVNGVWQTVEVNYGNTHVQGKIYPVSDYDEITNHVCQRQELLGANLWVVREIVFPVTEPGVPARRYSFGYNSDTSVSETAGVQFACGSPYQNYTRDVSPGMGGLSHMVTPTGAIVEYKYSRDLTNIFLFDTDDIPRETVTEKKVTHDGVSDVWTYAITESGGCGGTITEPDGSAITENCFPRDTSAGGYLISSKGGLSYRTNNSNKTIVERHWTLMKFYGANSQATGVLGETTINPVVDAEYTTLLDDTPNHNPVKMSAKTYQYDYNGNLLSETDYDWFDPTGIQRDTEGVPTGVPGGALLRSVSHSYYNAASESTSTNVYAKRLLATATPLILGALKETSNGPAVTQLSYDGNPYDVAPTVGNLTSKRVWDDVDSKWITTSSTYDSYGNVVTTTDGREKVTTIGYLNPALGWPTSVTVDPQNGTGVQTTSTTYDQSTGLVTSTTDANGQTSNIYYTNQLLGTVDPFGRPGVVEGPLVNANGVNQHQRVTTTYLDGARQVIVAGDLYAENDKLLKTRTTADMLGRAVLTEQTEDGTNYTISARKAYDTTNRMAFSSSPMRSGAAVTDSWTRVTSDIAGRVIEVATFGGATQPSTAAANQISGWTGSVTTSYYANTVTVTDQAGKQRQSVSDALGRLKEVYEDPNGLNYLTSYDYDVLGNLLHVYQGSQTRTFTYDSLSRLRSALNPESGTITYTYDDNGNLQTKTDALGVVSTYVYDALNRATSRGYSDGTPTVSYAYDTAGIANSKGKLTSVSSSVSTYSYRGFDATGKVLGGAQTLGSQTYSLSYGYDLSGHVKTMTYPSGRTVNYAYDNAGRTNSLTGNLGDGTSRNYATGITYDAGSRMTQEQFGTTTPIFNKLFYNSRGQLAEIREGLTGNNTSWERGAIINFYSTCWGMCAGQSMPYNNGNLLRQEHWIQNESGQVIGIPTQEFEYDSLNRLQWVKEGTNWKQQYSYDRYGNRLIDQASTFGDGIPKPDFGLDTNSNRLSAPAGYTMSYDPAGNLINDTYSGQGQRTYDAENRMKQAWANGQWQTYSYDGDGRRVKRNVNGTETWQVYGLGGELLAEYAANTAPTLPQKEYGYRNGQLLVTATAPVGSGTGLQAQYYDNMNFTNLKVTRTDATVDFDWGGGTPDSSLGVDTFTTRWTGKVEPQYSQTYTFYTQTDDGVRLWVNGQLLIDKWIDQGPTEWSGQITLTAGQRYDIRMDFYENGGGAMARLSWSSASQPKQIIPQARLYPPGSTSQVSINWLVSDQLGTPRIVFDQTGSLSGISRHDYLPFGEELYAAGRTPQLGYTGSDGARQKFTQKERDIETGLDYFGARYYASMQGRFTSVDPLMASAYVENPQSWNRYTYALNNPLKYVDPDGQEPEFKDYKDLTDDERRILENSKVTVGKGKDAQTLSGQALYDYMKTSQQKQLANFLNQTAVLSSVTFSNGRSAISYVNSVSEFRQDRIFANVDSGFIDQVRNESAKDSDAGKRYVGPEDSGTLHGDFDTAFRENRAFTSQQLSFASKQKFGAADIDIDEECPCGDAALKHAGRVVVHRLFGGKTDPYFIYERLTRPVDPSQKGRGLKPSYRIVK